MTFRGLLLTACLLALNALHAQVVVNEVCASNVSVNADNFGAFEDWIELYNTTGAAANLGGWWLSDDPSTPQKWAFPAGTSIPANGHLLVYCSGRNTTAAPYHTNFKLTQTAQEHAVLSDAGGAIVDDFGFTLANRCQVDHSRGRNTDGAAAWSLFTTPTPNAPNTGAGNEYMARPVLNPAAGFYGGAQNVSITSANAGAVIRYTLDGSAPTAASPTYAGPIPVNATTVVRAACFSSTPGIPPSFVETNTYFINSNHTVAVLSVAGDEVDDLLNGNGSLQPLGSFEYFGPDQLLRHEATGEFNEHGNDSWAYDQRGFDYITRDQTGYNDAIHYPVFRTKNRDKFQRLIIKAAANDNYPATSDGAHIRDAFVNALSQVNHLKLDERSYEPCVVYLNGQYWGVYEIREKVDDADFTKEYYDQSENDVYMLKTWGGTWSEYGGPAAQADWDNLRAYIMANNMADPVAFAYVDGLYNWKSMVDYFCLNSYVVCSDWLNWNTQWWRGLNPNGDAKRWRYCLWDEDATFGHYINYTGLPSQAPDADPCNPESLGDPGGQGHVEVLNKLVTENDSVHDYYVNRYVDMGNSIFNCTYIIPFLDSLITLIQPEMQAHVNRWGGTVATWQANVQAMRDFITQRCSAIQQGMVDCYNLNGPYRVVYKVDPPLSGSIAINSLTPPAYPFEGDYYGGINTTLAAIPSSGWAFSHWTTVTSALAPGTTDSLVTTDITAPDTIIAHFIPPITYDVVLSVDPLNGARVDFNGITYTSFPVTVQVPGSVPIPMEVMPNPYFDFLRWEIRQNAFASSDNTLLQQEVAFFEGDTIVAHLEPQQYAFYVPNSFSPNADGINDVWHPWANVVDLESFQLRIFDRWGQLMLETRDPQQSWDGTVNGTLVQGGVYAFHASVTNAITKEQEDIRGHVTVLR